MILREIKESFDDERLLLYKDDLISALILQIHQIMVQKTNHLQCHRLATFLHRLVAHDRY